jgi:monofunctional glycosyltransferase
LKTSSKKRRKRSKKKFQIRLGRLAFDILLCFLALTLVPVIIFRYVDPPSTPLMWIRWSSSSNAESQRSLDTWQSLESISPHLLKAVIAAEDQKFFSHHGFDWKAIEYAIQVNLTSDRKIGASTISMQTARNVFLWQKRTWLRKILEGYFTTLIEIFWDKRRILEVYLNVIEWGEGVFGCEKAAQKYFKRSSYLLSPVESAWMAAVLPNPRQWSRQPVPIYVRARQAKILDSMATLRIPIN